MNFWEDVIEKYGNGFEAFINFLLFFIFSLYIFLILSRWISHKLNLYLVSYYIDKFFIKIFEWIPNQYIKSLILKLFKIEPEILILLPKPSERNYQYLGYLLNGINHFLDKNPIFRDKIKIILIDNSTQKATEDDIEKFVSMLSGVRRYIIIATMSDIFDTLLSSSKIEKRLKNGYNLIRVIGVLASQSRKYIDYEDNSNIIRVSPPDFDEARKASVHIVSKLISSYCPSKTCEYHKDNNIIIISSNSYGKAVKDSFGKLFAEHKKELDIDTNPKIEEHDIMKKISEYRYSFDDKWGIVEDRETTNINFNDLVKEKMNNSINIIFIIGYEPNVSRILQEIDRRVKSIEFKDGELEILISATISIKNWRKSVRETIRNLSIKDKIDEVNFIKMRYPEFHFDKYKTKKIYFKLCHFKEDNSKLEEFKIDFYKDKMEEIIFKDEENYINSFINMSLEFAKEINKDWNINLLSLKSRFFYKNQKWMYTNQKIITGVKILNNGDSIDHFKIKKIKF